MGIEHVITCDRCERVIDTMIENFTSINAKFETDDNVEMPARDVRKSEHAIFCIQCAERVWWQVVVILDFTTNDAPVEMSA